MFLDVYKSIRDRRIEAKKRRKEDKRYSTVNETFKLSLNGAIGNFIQKYSWLYDPLANMKVTVNNQLLILKWIEMLYLAGFKTISANTKQHWCSKTSLIDWKSLKTHTLSASVMNAV